MQREAYQFSHQTPGGEVALQEHDKVSFREEDTREENDNSRLCPNSLLEGVKTSSRKHKSTNVWDKGQSIDDERGPGTLPKSNQEVEDSILRFFLLRSVAMSRVLSQIWVIHRS